MDDPFHQEFDEAFAAAAQIREPAAAERAGKPGRLARPGRVRHLVTTSLTALLFLAVLGAAGWGITVGFSTQRAVPGPAAAQSSPRLPPTATPSARLAADPFAGSPAESYAAGAAGIVPPAAHRVGSYPAAQVRAAYARVRQMLIAAGLNWRTLRGGTPAAFARLLIPEQRGYFDRHLDRARSTRGWVNSFAPGSVRFASEVIKVHGFLTARTATDAGNRAVLRIKADYLFVYAVAKPGVPTTRIRVVDRYIAWVDFAQWDDPQGPLEPWLTRGGGSAAPSLCGTADGFIHPVFATGQPQRVQPSGSPVNPYDQSIPPPKSCRRITGT